MKRGKIPIDFTQQKVAQNLSDTIVESSFDAIITTDLNANVISWNPAAKDLYGYETKETNNFSLNRILPVSEQDNFKNMIKEIQQGHSIKKKEFIHIHKDGHLINVYVTISPIKNENNKIVGVSLIIHDITIRKRLEKVLELKAEELKYINKVLTDFAYTVSHDLKAPLRAIISLVSWIEEDCYEILHGESKKHFDLLKYRAQCMEKFIHGLLEYYYVGKKLEVSKVDVSNLLKDIVKTITIPPDFSIHIASNMPTLSTIEVPLRQVFSNLLVNAIEHHHNDKGIIWVTASKQDNHYLFCVKDDGPGIPEKYLDKVFNLYEKIDSNKNKTSGIGLAIVKKIVDQFKGKIWVESKENEGSSFYFTWPINTESLIFLR